MLVRVAVRRELFQLGKFCRETVHYRIITISRVKRMRSITTVVARKSKTLQVM